MKGRAGMEKELQNDFSKWVNDEVVRIVKKYQKEEDYCQEKWAIEFKINGYHAGTFSLLINQDDNAQDEIQVIPGEYKDADITVVGEWKYIEKILKRKTTLKKECKAEHLTVGTKYEGKEVEEHIKAASKSLSGNLSLGLIYFGWFLIVVGILLVMKSVYGACNEHSSDYFFARPLQNGDVCKDNYDSNPSKEIVGFFEEMTKVGAPKYDIDNLDNVDQDQFKLIGVYCISDEEPIYVYNNNTQENRNIHPVWAFMGAILIIAGGIFHLISKTLPKSPEVSKERFFVVVLCIPIFIMSVCAILFRFNILTISDVFKWYGRSEIFCLIIWFENHLWRRREDLSPNDYDKLDLFSTIATVALTFIWVIYDISSFKLYFGIILVTFMVVQAQIKMIKIDEDSKS